jgi:chromosome condensin MukBEF MukE localization factor
LDRELESFNDENIIPRSGSEAKASKNDLDAQLEAYFDGEEANTDKNKEGENESDEEQTMEKTNN